MNHRFPATSDRPILILGASGQVGRALAQKLDARALAVSRQEADLANPTRLPILLDSLRPSVVINAAAYTQVDRAEQEEPLVQIINGEAPGILARWCAAHDVPFVHYSTDYVYSGEGISPWTEDAPVSPVNAYGRTKLMGDLAVAGAGGNWLIFRTSWVYDTQGKNFLNTIIRLGKERESLRIISDQHGAPTYAPDLADATLEILGRALTQPRFPNGVYHLCNSGETTWHEFATEILVRVREQGAELKVRNIEAIPTTEYPLPARRPLNSRLSLEKVHKIFGIKLPNWRLGLRRCLQEMMYF
ncbi:dTDP-4-dehydrorhamnose reductase [Gammaproteobacteria bacterium]